ncbi:sensor histidine kinase [Lihuaxuella thermophila]|nr:HAMP domain-containing sensor histidine kinase [Lihuaxuella thermophila]
MFSFQAWFIYIWTPALLVLPLITIIVVKFFISPENLPGGSGQEPQDQMQINRVKEEILSNPDRWSDEAWQRSLDSRLQTFQMQVQLLDRSNAIIFSRVTDTRGSSAGMERKEEYTYITSPVVIHRIYKGEEYIGAALFYPNPIVGGQTKKLSNILYSVGDLVIPVSGLGILATLLLIQSWFVKRYVITPLTRLEQASKVVSHKDFDFELSPVKTPVREITELMNAFALMKTTLQRTLKREAQIEQERKIFISSIIHDLRTPLFSIRGYLEGLQQGIAQTPEMVKKYISVSLDKCRILERLISDLFLYAKLDYLEDEPNYQHIRFIEFLTSLTDSFEHTLKQKHMSVKREFPEDSFTMKADPYLLHRAIGNIIDNAIHHSPEHSTITLSCTRSGREVTIQITNEGPGIPPEHLHHIFKPLYRIEQSRSRRTGGAGLGLAITKHIIEKHRGEITAANTVNGTRFTIHLPVCEN